jgi:carbon storage regulator
LENPSIRAIVVLPTASSPTPGSRHGGSMLTLTRKAGQKIRIGDDIEIVVREIRGRQVRLGISAPNGLPVYREELYQQILAEGEAGSDESADDADKSAAERGEDNQPAPAEGSDEP